MQNLLSALAQFKNDLVPAAPFRVLQRDVECHGRIVSSVVRLCGGADVARALERRWHLLYLRAIEWQCHLEACLAKTDQKYEAVEAASDSDDEPALKQPRLSRRGSPKRQRTPVNNRRRDYSEDSRQSASEEEQEYAVGLTWRNFGSDCESESMRDKMADERRVPSVDGGDPKPTDQTVPVTDEIDGSTIDMPREIKTPPTVIKRKKPVDTSRFNQSDRKSKNCATFYFRHHDTDSDRQVIETDEKSQDESSEEEWTYVNGPKIANEDSTDIMTSSVEIQCELPIEKKIKPKLESSTPDLLKVDQNTRCNKDIERLVNQAEELVQKQAQQMAKKKGSRNFKPLMLEEEGKSVSRAKMSRIKEWLNQSTDGKDDSNQTAENYDASGEYTTESEVDTSLTSEERNLHSSMDMSTSTCTVTPTHQAKVQLRKKRGGNSARPWSVSCLSQLSGANASLATPTNDVISHNMSISESALNTLASPQRVTPANSSSKLRGSSTTVQGHISSTNTMTEACTSCVEANDKQCWLRRKRLKLRRNNNPVRRERLVKSLSFCGRLSPEIEKIERSAASDPATSRKSRFDTTSTSGNDSDEELIKQQVATIANLRRSIEKTHISSKDQDSAIPEQNENEQVTPSFKIGPEGGMVRPRLTRSMERERSFLALSLGDPSQMWDLCVDKDSDKSATAGTEEHSSFSEQAWDFYQEKYNSEPYSEAPDSDAARRLLEFGDDYRAFLDSQSDCCSSLSAQPENEQSPSGTRRRRPPSDISRERSLPRHKRPSRNSPVETPVRKPKKSMSSAERKKNLLDSLERSRNNTSIESNDGTRRRKPSESERKNNKRSPDFDLLNGQSLNRRRHSSNLTSDEINSSLEYTEVNNRPDILDSLNRRRKENGEAELQKVALSELRRRSTESGDSDESSSPKHSRRNWGDSDSESEEVRSLVRRSSTQLEVTEAILARQDSSPDLLRAFDYTEVVTRCRENLTLLEVALADSSLSPGLQRDVRAVSARWSALRAAAIRRGGARRLRREIAALRETLDDVCEPGDHAPQPHTRAQLHRRIEELKERLSRLLECKVSMLKLTVSVRRTLGELETDESGLTTDLTALLAAWDDAHQRTSNELLSLERAVSAWAEWENALRELQGALRGDLATLQALRDKGSKLDDQSEVAAQIKQLAASLIDKKKGGSTCDSLSDSGISDGDSENAGGRARRLSALRELAKRLQEALAPNSPAHRAITKRMEQTENEVKILQESCRALVEQSIPDLKIEEDGEQVVVVASKTGSGDPDYIPRSGWVWRVLRSSIPIQLCLVALLLAAWLVERPRCCDALNSLAQTLTPQLRYVRGPPPV
ncbi:unnamed protein product [Leptosia nina]|uniref:KASH domain-containing protein n=1 Tax=Leptosia nina TaxID=320188 RepID=A0AAV1JAU5_9NEOP